MNRCTQRRASLAIAGFCFCAFAVLSLSFYADVFGVAERNWFVNLDVVSERALLGRLIKSRQDGVFSLAGLNVFGISAETAKQDPSTFFGDTLDNRAAYVANRRIENFTPPYYSQIHGQGMLYGLLDKIIPLAPAVKLRLFHAIAAMLTAGVLTVILAWFFTEFGPAAAAAALVSALLSQWLTVFARNLWWSTWAFYLPMAMVMLYFRFTQHERDTTYPKLGSIIFFSVLLKTIFNGYEYITTTLVMMMVPFVYHCLLNRVALFSFVRGAVKAALAAGCAIAVSLCILLLQVYAAAGNFSDGISHIVSSFQRRTHAEAGQFGPLYADSHKAGTAAVILSYVRGEFCGFPVAVPPGAAPPSTSARFSLSYAQLMTVFALMSLCLYLAGRKKPESSGRRRAEALILAAWFSMLAPLSWFVIFKAHSYIHQHLNFIVWQMPFTLFGAAVTGLAISTIAGRLRAKPEGASTDAGDHG